MTIWVILIEKVFKSNYIAQTCSKTPDMPESHAITPKYHNSQDTNFNKMANKKDFLKIINLYRNGASSSNCAAIKKVEEDSNTDTTNGQIKEEKD